MFDVKQELCNKSLSVNENRISSHGIPLVSLLNDFSGLKCIHHKLDIAGTTIEVHLLLFLVNQVLFAIPTLLTLISMELYWISILTLVLSRYYKK